MFYKGPVWERIVGMSDEFLERISAMDLAIRVSRIIEGETVVPPFSGPLTDRLSRIRGC